VQQSDDYQNPVTHESGVNAVKYKNMARHTKSHEAKS